jgi:hypothetical protein
MNLCKVPECESKAFGHGYCNMHYKRWKKNGDPGQATTLKRAACSVPKCPEPHRGLGFCDTHLVRFKATGNPPETPIRRYGADKGTCPRRFCENKISCKGLCKKHHARQKLFQAYQDTFTWEDYDRLWDSQGGLCAICKGELVWDSKGTHVDHCHKGTGVRGLLCNTCNMGLGMFRDDVSLLANALKYLNN